VAKLLIPFGPLGDEGGITMSAARDMARACGGKVRHVAATEYAGWVIEIDSDVMTAALVAMRLEGRTSVILGSKWSDTRG